MSAQSRRHLLEQAFALPIALRSLKRSPPSCPLECRIVSGPDCLSEESAAGYRMMIERHRPCALVSGSVLIFAAARNVSQDRLLKLRSLVFDGAWLIWENSPVVDDEREFLRQQQLFRDIFDLRLAKPRVAQHGTGSACYIHYRWPAPAMVRTFMGITPVQSTPTEAIAHYEEQTIATKKQMGRGGIIFLGSLLGPHLRAEDREASRLALALVETAL